MLLCPSPPSQGWRGAGGISGPVEAFCSALSSTLSLLGACKDGLCRRVTLGRLKDARSVCPHASSPERYLPDGNQSPSRPAEPRRIHTGSALQ